MDDSFLYFVYSTLASDVQTYYRCPTECSGCTFPNNCTGCINGYTLVGVTCTPNDAVQSSHCVQNLYVTENVCQEYCHRKCKSCNKTKYDCVECSEFYTKDSTGECVIENESLSIFVSVRPLLNLVRKKGMKFLFMAIDDLWLYQYHKKKYDGIVKTVFSTISFI